MPNALVVQTSSNDGWRTNEDDFRSDLGHLLYDKETIIQEIEKIELKINNLFTQNGFNPEDIEEIKKVMYRSESLNKKEYRSIYRLVKHLDKNLQALILGFRQVYTQWGSGYWFGGDLLEYEKTRQML